MYCLLATYTEWKAQSLLATLFIFPENEVKTKINSLRTYYSKEVAKTKKSSKSGNGLNDAYESKWPYFNSLSFLRDTVVPRKLASNIVNTVSISWIRVRRFD